MKSFSDNSFHFSWNTWSFLWNIHMGIQHLCDIKNMNQCFNYTSDGTRMYDWHPPKSCLPESPIPSLLFPKFCVTCRLLFQWSIFLIYITWFCLFRTLYHFTFSFWDIHLWFSIKCARAFISVSLYSSLYLSINHLFLCVLK